MLSETMPSNGVVVSVPAEEPTLTDNGGIFLDLEDFADLYSRCARPPTFVNDLDQNDVASRERLNELLLTTYESDTLESVPSCSCGNLHGGTSDVTQVCEICGTSPAIPAEREIESQLWIRTPDGVRGLIHPLLLGYLDRFFGSNGASIIQYLMDPFYRPKKKSPQLMQIDRSPHRRGLNYFIDNFDAVFEFLLYGVSISKTKKAKERFAHFIRRNRTKLFPKALPIPSKITFIVESTPTGKFGDGTIESALDAVRTIGGISSGVECPRLDQLESKAFRASMQLMNFYDVQYSKSLSPKPGWFRRHVFGSRPAFSFRAVISSLSEEHRYNEVHLPWSLSVSLFKQHLRNKLQRRGFSPSASNQYVNDHIETYSPLLDELFQELIAEATEQSRTESIRNANSILHNLPNIPPELVYDQGIPCVIQRNPSLKRLSAQRFFITKIKTDPAINTISLSVLVLKGPNADFDGDALNGILILDAVMRRGLEKLASHYGVMDMHTPWKLSGDIALPGPVLSTIDHWLSTAPKS